MITGRAYVGQSRNIEKRINEHIRHGDSSIDRDIRLYGKDKFLFILAEECEEDRLDELEKYYINEFDSYRYGYNKTTGGKDGIGQGNSNHKLTEQDVFNIREAYKNHENKSSVYQLYKDKITEYYFSNLWEGNSWNYIHMDVYTPENLEYYKRGTSCGELSTKALFTDDEVIKFRKMYQEKSAKEIYNEYNIQEKCKFQTFQAILWGRHYKNLPVFSKKKKD